MKRRLSSRRRLHLYFAWGIAGVLTAIVGLSLNIFHLLSIALLTMLVLKDAYDEVKFRVRSQEPKWWDKFEHSTTAIVWATINIFSSRMDNIIIGIGFFLDFLWDIYQDYRTGSLR